ncbi:MAG: glycosyltransferase family 4 protein [Alphaproteobacteria bacterium]
MSICIQYARPTSGLTGAEIFGLDVAVNNLLSGWFKYGKQEKFLIRPTDDDSFAHCKTLARQNGLDPEQKLLGIDPRFPVDTLRHVHCLVQPDPLVTDAAWLRRQIPGAGYALCGLIHTMSGERIARVVSDLCVAPMTEHDALICPSHAIKSAVENLWAGYGDYLAHRFGNYVPCPVQLPVIPLGVDTAKFSARTTADKRATQRKILGAAPDEVILLFLGRMSFATKAHPAPLFLAAEQAALRSRKTIRLVMYGYYKPEQMEASFKNLGADICRNVKLDFIANDDARFPDGLWAGADIFISLVDNIQESFGLTPVEAMAAGLPAIISDWDGYRDSIRDGEDGFTIPTYAPPIATGLAISDRYFNRRENYGEYLTTAAQSCAVDVGKTATAIATLADNPELRMRFAASGRKRAQDIYGWRHIITAYEELWGELGKRRRATPPADQFPAHWQAAHPAYPNPYAMFASFPTESLTSETRMVFSGDVAMFSTLIQHEMNYFTPDLLLPKEDLLDLAQKFTSAAAIGPIVAAYPAAQRDHVWRSCGWLLKFGLCQIKAAS